MDSESTQLELNPDVIQSKDTKQETTSIDKKYGVSLFQDKDSTYSLYDYDSVNNNIYENDTDYQLNIDTNQFANLYTTPAVYSVDTSIIDVDYTNLLYTILLIQIVVVVYFVYRIMKVRGTRWIG